MDKLAAEEYKQVFGFTITIEEKVIRIFLVSVAVSVSLLSATAGLIFSGKLPVEFESWAMYVLVILNMISVPAFNLILAQRIDLARAAAYQQVFYEENDTYAGWVRRLGKLRTIVGSPESFDTVPLTYWSILIISSVIFVAYVVIKDLPYFHLAIISIFVVMLARLNVAWSGKTRIDYVSEWRKVLEEETHNKSMQPNVNLPVKVSSKQ